LIHKSGEAELGEVETREVQGLDLISDVDHEENMDHIVCPEEFVDLGIR
jgi:hypothetical protein